MRIVALCIVLVTFTAGHVRSQAARILSPARNHEICLGDSVAVIIQVSNPDTVARTILSLIRFTNVVPAASLYIRFDTLRDLPPGMSIERILPVYVTNPNILGQLGTFSACVQSNALDDSNRIIADWPFRDSICNRFFGIRTSNLPFYDVNNDYDKASFSEMPDHRKWVSCGARVVEGELTTWDPPPPRTEPDDLTGYGPSDFRSPVLLLDRLDDDAMLYTGTDVGDTLSSFPFNLLGQKRFFLVFDFMRGGNQQYPMLWDSKKLIGPEGSIHNAQGMPVRSGDSLIIEFKDPSSAACNPEQWNYITGIEGDRDFDFQHFSLDLRDATSITYHYGGRDSVLVPITTNYFTKNFRFRVRLKASDHAANPTPRDDADPWYLDNIALQVPRKPDLEMVWVRVVTPYTKLPYSTTQALPVYMATALTAVPKPLRVSILNSKGETVYSQTKELSMLGQGADTILQFPDWNAQPALGTSSEFWVYGSHVQNGFDFFIEDNHTHSLFYLNVEQGSNPVQEFALDDAGITPGSNHGNDIPQLTGQVSQGIGFDGTSGSYAIKFTLNNPDTLFGTRVFFTNLNSSLDPIRISVLRGDFASCIPGDTITTFNDRRELPMNEFSKYRFPTPIPLSAGTYWLSVSQLSIDNYMIGGDISRGGAQIVVADSLSPVIAPIYSSPYGTQTSPWENTGDIRCMYAVEVPAGSGKWSPWMPDSGWWPAHTGSSIPQAIKLDLQLTAPFVGAGTYLPMIRPMVGSFGGVPLNVAKKPADAFAFEVYPNPFTPGMGMANFNFTLPETSVVSAILHDDLGRAVRTLADRRFEDGEHTLHWDGKDGTGNTVVNGVYTCQLSTESRSISVRILVVK